METKTHVPTFNVSLRGYDREEVDDYLDSLADALGHVEDADAQNRRLQSHINRLNNRIKELEDQVRDCMPRTGVALGDRVGSILREAEEAAGEIMRAAEARVAEADEIVGSAVTRGDEEARRIVAAARAEAHGILTEAEARAAARTRQIEQWAEQVISHARAEEARMLREQDERSAAARAELAALADRRRETASVLTSLRDTLGEALRAAAEGAEAAEESRALAGRPRAEFAPAPPAELAGIEAAVPGTASASEAPDGADTSEHEIIELRAIEPMLDEETQLEDWVSEGGRNFES